MHEQVGVDVCLVHPWELSDADWLEIAKLALSFAYAGEDNMMKCYILGYVEWVKVFEARGMKQ